MRPVPNGMGFLPLLVPAVAGAAKSAVIGKAMSAIGGLFGGDTALDKQRKAEVAEALGRALDGNSTGLSYLLARAGIRVDPNVKVAPKSIQHMFRTALRTYYGAVGIVPPPDIQKGLGMSAQNPTLEVASLVQGGPGGTSPVPGATPMTFGPEGSSVPSWVVPAVAIGGLLLMVSLTRGGRR